MKCLIKTINKLISCDNQRNFYVNFHICFSVHKYYYNFIFHFLIYSLNICHA